MPASLQGTDEGGKINLCGDISRSSILGGTPIQRHGETLPLRPVSYEPNTSAWAGTMLYPCVLKEGCLRVSDVSDEAAGAVWVRLPRLAQHNVRSTSTNKGECLR